MYHGWNHTCLISEAKALEVLAKRREKRWLCRGQSRRWNGLVPSIDRDQGQKLSRGEKLRLECQGINLFRSTAHFFSHQGEQEALADEISILMVLRHYKVRTRLLDWSGSPYVAAYFAACGNEKEDGEIWSFDEPLYEQKGKEQWKRWPETTTDGSGHHDKFDAKLTAFTLDEPRANWFICGFYKPGFPRQNVQASAYSLTARFGRDHAEAIATLLADPSKYHLYIVKAHLKPKLLKILREKHGIWRGSLYPDTAGAAETVADEVFSDWKRY